MGNYLSKDNKNNKNNISSNLINSNLKYYIEKDFEQVFFQDFEKYYEKDFILESDKNSESEFILESEKNSEKDFILESDSELDSDSDSESKSESESESESNYENKTNNSTMSNINIFSNIKLIFIYIFLQNTIISNVLYVENSFIKKYYINYINIRLNINIFLTKILNRQQLYLESIKNNISFKKKNE